MGNDIIKNRENHKIAIIITGYADLHFMKNLDEALEVLGGQGFETFVVSPEEPKNRHDHYLKSDVPKLNELLDGLKKEMGEADEVVLFITGHGTVVNEDATVCFKDDEDRITCETSYMKKLDELPYKMRTVILAPCYSGNANNLFLKKERTALITSGSRGEVTYGDDIASLFWGQTPDFNNDGFVSLKERYENAVYKSASMTRSIPQYVKSKGYLEKGEPPFDTQVHDIRGKKDFDEKRTSLSPGDYAIVLFSHDGNEEAKKYLPKFEAFAKEAKGEYLFLRTSDAGLISRYKIKRVPSVLIIDSRGVTRAVVDTENVFGELARFYAPFDNRYSYWHKRLFDKDLNVKLSALIGITSLFPQLNEDQINEIKAIAAEYLSSPSINVLSWIADFYSEIIDQLSDEEKNRVAPVFRTCMTGFTGWIRLQSIRSYGYIADKLTEAELMEGAKALRDLEDLDEDSKVAQIYAHGEVLERLPYAEALSGSRFIRDKYFADESEKVRKSARFYLPWRLDLKQEDVNEEVKQLKELYKKGNDGVRENVIHALAARSDKIDKKDLAEIVSLLKPFALAGAEDQLTGVQKDDGTYWSYLEIVEELPDDTKKIEAIQLLSATFIPGATYEYVGIQPYARLVGSLSNEHFAVAYEKIDSMLHSDDFRIKLVGIYANAGIASSEKTMQRLDPALRQRIKDNFYQGFSSIGDSDTKNFSKELKEQFRRTLNSCSSYILDNCLPDDPDDKKVDVEEIRKMRELFFLPSFTRGIQQNFIFLGTWTYDCLLEKSPHEDIVADAGKIRNLFNSAEEDTRKTARSMYSRCIKHLKEEDLKKEAGELAKMFYSASKTGFDEAMIQYEIIMGKLEIDKSNEVAILKKLFPYREAYAGKYALTVHHLTSMDISYDEAVRSINNLLKMLPKADAKEKIFIYVNLFELSKVLEETYLNKELQDKKIKDPYETFHKPAENLFHLIYKDIDNVDTDVSEMALHLCVKYIGEILDDKALLALLNKCDKSHASPNVAMLHVNIVKQLFGQPKYRKSLYDEMPYMRSLLSHSEGRVRKAVVQAVIAMSENISKEELAQLAKILPTRFKDTDSEVRSLSRQAYIKVSKVLSQKEPD